MKLLKLFGVAAILVSPFQGRAQVRIQCLPVKSTSDRVPIEPVIYTIVTQIDTDGNEQYITVGFSTASRKSIRTAVTGFGAMRPVSYRGSFLLLKKERMWHWSIT